MIACCQRSSDAVPTARALFRRGLLGAWRRPWFHTAGRRSADCLRFLAEMKAVDPGECLDVDDSNADDFVAIPDSVAAVLTGSRVHL